MALQSFRGTPGEQERPGGVAGPAAQRGNHYESKRSNIYACVPIWLELVDGYQLKAGCLAE